MPISPVLVVGEAVVVAHVVMGVDGQYGMFLQTSRSMKTASEALHGSVL
jgi:hypothetical protein